jgi:outer membrane protein TolC
VQQARSVLGATESLIPVLEMGRRKAQNRLCTLMGMPPRDLEAELGGPGATPSAPPEVAVGIPAELLRRRPDVRRAEREAAAQCARIGIAESELYPQFAITGNIAFESQYFSDLFDWDSIAGSIGPSFRWNVLNYWRIRNNIGVEEARFSQAVLNYQETVLRANEEAENAITAYLREQARVKSLEQSTAATARAVELANIQYEQGLIDFQRVLDSQRALVNQQDTLAESRGNVALNLIALYKALGGGWAMRLEPNLASQAIPAQTPFEEEPLPAEQATVPTLAPPVPEDVTAEGPHYPPRRVAS